MSMKWIVYLEFNRVRDFDATQLMLGAHRELNVHVARYGTSGIHARFECHGRDAQEAIQVACDAIEEDVLRGRLSQADSVRCHRASRPEPVPELFGPFEIARLLGVSRQRVAQLIKNDDFPAMVAKLAMGPVFTADAVRRFQDGWDRKVGRPRLPSFAKDKSAVVSREWRELREKTAGDAKP
jgi:hypothetical protein